MDWVDYVPGDGFYPAMAHRTGKPTRPAPGGGSYDAIRVYLWAGMHDGSGKARTEMLKRRSCHERIPCQS
jgi:endo-1,4-beta-D-glucanase Y